VDTVVLLDAVVLLHDVELDAVVVDAVVLLVSVVVDPV